MSLLAERVGSECTALGLNESCKWFVLISFLKQIFVFSLSLIFSSWLSHSSYVSGFGLFTYFLSIVGDGGMQETFLAADTRPPHS